MSPVSDLTARRLLSVVAREQATGRLPSLAAGVVRDGRLVWSGEYGGLAGSSTGPGPDVQYRIGSITKTMTAVLVMQLRDEGLLDLSDRLDAHLPGVGYGDRTIRTLLAHSSGMQSEPDGSWWERSPGVPFDTLADTVDDSRAPFASGETFHYTNLAYALLGELVARRRGSTWWDQVQERLLRPLGMERTSYLPEQPAADGFSVHHFAGTLTPEPAQDTGAMAPAGQAWSTVCDLATYAGFLLGGHPDVLAPATLTEMRTPLSGTAEAGLSSGQGLGLRLTSGGSGTLVGHTGSMPGFLAGLLVDPVRRTGAVCLANGTVGLRCAGLPGDLLDELERSEPTVVDAWVPATDLPEAVEELLGLWHWGNTVLAFSWAAEEVLVTSAATGAVNGRFLPTEDGSFLGTAGYHHGETLRVVRNPDGSPNHLVCATFVYTREPYDPRAPIPGGAPTRS